MLDEAVWADRIPAAELRLREACEARARAWALGKVAQIKLLRVRKMLDAEPWFKCSCCGAEYARAEWLLLPVPRSGVYQHQDDAPPLCLRNCTCGSTLGVQLDARWEMPE